MERRERHNNANKIDHKLASPFLLVPILLKTIL